ncbi:hypothetical protein [Halomonas casei]|uniref:hypothetical protein n=1 Tax=Halomonas casei TaxID=2742613 RepID=UPI0038990041
MRMMILLIAEFTTVVAEYCADTGIVRFEEGQQHVVAGHVNGRNGQLVGVKVTLDTSHAGRADLDAAGPALERHAPGCVWGRPGCARGWPFRSLH